MTLDQKLQIWVAVGTWVAGLGSFAAAFVALYLSRRREKVRLRIQAGMRLIVGAKPESGYLPPKEAASTPRAERCMAISVTNLGGRPVTIDEAGWAAGKGKHRRVAIQTVSGPYTSNYPTELTHGKRATFRVFLTETPNWASQIAEFVEGLPDKSLKSFVVYVLTSTGQTIEAHPEQNLLDEIKKARQSAASSSTGPNR